jgi:dihydroxyacid dehydratase/phosphogluconate dehydratase
MATMDTRLDGMNEFRDTLRDQSAQFVTRDEYLTGHAGVVRNADVMRIDLSTSAVRIEQSDRAAAMERAQLDKRLDALNEFRVQLQH